MKKIAVLSILSLFVIKTFAQIALRPMPKEDFENRIAKYVDELQLIDTHEHLLSSDIIKGNKFLDFMLLIHHYGADDLKSAGMSGKVFNLLMKDSLSVMEKWKIVKPFWNAASNTAYNRTVLLAADKLFGISDLNDKTVELLSKKIKEAYESKNWYNYVLKKKSNIKYAIQDVGNNRVEGDMFRYVQRFDNFVWVHSKKDIRANENGAETEVQTLDDYITALQKAFKNALQDGIVGVKSGLAYKRILHYEEVEKKQAQLIFDQLMSAPEDTSYSFKDVKPLQDYMMYRIIELAGENNLPIQIHTGLLAGDGNIITNTNPTHLTNVFLHYKDIKFIIFHSSYPYGGELSTLAKNFRNVYIDMCWSFIISPSYSERYLHEWLETVPASKIMAFGGDYRNVENVFAHSLMARSIVAKVLIEKVKTGYLTESEAKKIARMLLFENAANMFGFE